MIKYNEDDVLEHALNFGIVSAGKRFHVSDKVILGIVNRFVGDVSIPCACVINNLNGNHTMCFHCTGPEFQSISLRQRISQLWHEPRIIPSSFNS